jgi:hypothetical protein
VLSEQKPAVNGGTADKANGITFILIFIKFGERESF